MKGFICGPRIYKYKDCLFEVHYYCGPWPIDSEGELLPLPDESDSFWDLFEEWDALEDKEDYRVGGGCERIGLTLHKKDK